MQPWGAGPLFDFQRSGGAPAPVLLSVPHAGRCYTPELIAWARVPEPTLWRLEDRYADLLIEDLVARGFPALVAQVPRAVIDLNRDPRDIDVKLVGAVPRGQPLIQSVKQRGGLGLFPRSLPRCGDLWRGVISWEEAHSRITLAHEPYHATLEQETELLRHSHGEVLLVDVHSMPPLPPFASGLSRADVVIGDRFGTSASRTLVELACSVIAAHGYVAALNHPYPGSYLIERHGKPESGRHALQIEISRDLYLDDQMESPGPGLGRVRTMVTQLVEELGRELGGRHWSEAAE